MVFKWIAVDLIAGWIQIIYALAESNNESTLLNKNYVYFRQKIQMNINNSCSCCPPDSNQAVNGNIYSKVKAPNKAKIKTASRILKNLVSRC